MKVTNQPMAVSKENTLLKEGNGAEAEEKTSGQEISADRIVKLNSCVGNGNTPTQIHRQQPSNADLR